MRFLLERSAAPALLTSVVGVTWMAPVAGAWFASCLRDGDRQPRSLLRPLLGYAYLVRGFVAAVAVGATTLRLGTHYDVSPLTRVTLELTGTVHTFESGSLGQIFWLTLVPQLVVWPLFTVAAGLAGGILLWRWLPRSLRRQPTPLPAEAPISRGED
jgi:hypothetical protein